MVLLGQEIRERVTQDTQISVCTSANSAKTLTFNDCHILLQRHLFLFTTINRYWLKLLCPKGEHFLSLYIIRADFVGLTCRYISSRCFEFHPIRLWSVAIVRTPDAFRKEERHPHPVTSGTFGELHGSAKVQKLTAHLIQSLLVLRDRLTSSWNKNIYISCLFWSTCIYIVLGN